MMGGNTMPRFFAPLARLSKLILLFCIFLTMLQMVFFPSFISLLILAGLIIVLVTFFLGGPA